MPQSFLDSLPATLRTAVVCYRDAADVTGVADGAAIPSTTEFISGATSTHCNATYSTTNPISRPAFNYAGSISSQYDNTIVFPDTSMPLFDSALKSTELTLCHVAVSRDSDAGAEIFEYNQKIRLDFSGAEVGTTLPNNGVKAPGVGANQLMISIQTFSNNYPAYTGGTLSNLMCNGSWVSNASSSYSPNANNRDVHFGSNRGLAAPFNGWEYMFLAFNRELAPEEGAVLTAAIQTYLNQVPTFTQQEVLLIDGNSIPNGVGAVAGNKDDAFPYLVASGLSRPYGTWHNVCRSGSNVQEAAASFEHRIGWVEDHYQKTAVVVANYWVNEDATGSDFAQESRDYAAMRGLNTYFIWGTPPHGGWSSAQEARRQQDIVDILATPGEVSLFWPLHLDSQIGVSGSYGANPSLFLDAISHLTSAGQVVAANSIVALYPTYSVPAYIGFPVISVGQQYIGNENPATATRLNRVSTNLPSVLAHSGGGTLLGSTSNDTKFALDTQGYVLINQDVSTVGVFNPEFTVTNEAGTSDPVSVEVEVVDIDETLAPTLPGISLLVTHDSPNNVAGAILGTINTSNLTSTPVLSGEDAARFTVSQEDNVLSVAIVSPLEKGDYLAVLSSENRDPDGQFVVPISSVITVSVVTETQVLVAYDADLTCGHTRLRDLTEAGGVLTLDDYGKFIRIHVGFNLKGTPILEFYPKTGSTGAFTVSTDEGVEVGGKDVIAAKGALYEAQEYITYLLPEDRFTHAGAWGVNVIERSGVSETKIGTVGFTVKE